VLIARYYAKDPPASNPLVVSGRLLVFGPLALELVLELSVGCKLSAVSRRPASLTGFGFIGIREVSRFSDDESGMVTTPLYVPPTTTTVSAHAAAAGIKIMDNALATR